MPLRPLSELLHFLGEPSQARGGRLLPGVDLVVAQEPQPSVTPEDVYNGGVYLLRVSDRSRAWLHSWLGAFEDALASAHPPATNQPALRRSLVASDLRFATFPSDVVAARVFPWLRTWRPRWTPPFEPDFHSLRNTTVAYHAIALNWDPSLANRGRGEDNKILTMRRAAAHAVRGVDVARGDDAG